MKKLLTVVLALCIVPALIYAGDVPASKAAAKVGNLVELAKSCLTTSGDPTSCAQSTPWTTIQELKIKTANAKDLAIDTAFNCGLVTFTQIKSKGGDLDGSMSAGRIKVRVAVTEADTNGEKIPGAEPVYAYPNDDHGVTYCSRLQVMWGKFMGTDCYVDTSDAGTAQDPLTCANPEELALLLGTLDANAFNFLLPNVTAGVKVIEVQAKAQAASALFGTQAGNAFGAAFLGVGSTLVEEVRLVKDAEVLIEP